MVVVHMQWKIGINGVNIRTEVERSPHKKKKRKKKHLATYHCVALLQHTHKETYARQSE